MVLAKGVDVHADFLDLFGDLHGRLDALVFRGRPARGGVGGDIADAEDADLHDVPFRGRRLPAAVLTIADINAFASIDPYNARRVGVFPRLCGGGPEATTMRDGSRCHPGKVFLWNGLGVIFVVWRMST